MFYHLAYFIYFFHLADFEVNFYCRLTDKSSLEYAAILFFILN